MNVDQTRKGPLAEFYLARLADVEAVALAATPGRWSTADNGSITHEGPNRAKYGSVWGACVVASVGAHSGRKPSEPDAAHIALHDPVSALADVAAKRLILEAVDLVSPAYDTSAVARLNLAICHWAAQFREHPDYDPSWAPELWEGSVRRSVAGQG